jgi:hypothetical protein
MGHRLPIRMVGFGVRPITPIVRLTDHQVRGFAETGKDRTYVPLPGLRHG